MIRSSFVLLRSVMSVNVASHSERFSEIQKKLGLAKNILSSRLKKLIEDGVLEIQETEGQRRYVLTEKGRDLYVVLVALWQWGEAHCTDKPRAAVRAATGAVASLTRRQG